MAASSSTQVTDNLWLASHTNPNLDMGNSSQEGIVDDDEDETALANTEMHHLLMICT